MDEVQVLLRTFADSFERTADGKNVVTISTGTIDRFGTVLNPRGWDLVAYRKNPVVLWAHQRSELPIGVAKRVFAEGDKLRAEFDWVSGDLNPWAQQVKRFYDEGILKGFSVGFRVLEAKEPEKPGDPIRFEKLELVEFSAVPVPANPEALADSWEPLARMFEAARSVKFVQTGASKFRAVSISDGEKRAIDWNAIEAMKRVDAWAAGDAKKRAKAYAIARGTELLLPHHDVAEAGNLVTSRDGIEQAVAMLEFVVASDDELAKAYDHLSAHAEQFEIEIPELDEVNAARSKAWTMKEIAVANVKGPVWAYRVEKADAAEAAKMSDEIQLRQEDKDALTTARGLIDQVLTRAPAKVEEKPEDKKDDEKAPSDEGDAGVIEISG